MGKLRMLRAKYFAMDMVFISIILCIPFLFYLYSFAPHESDVWETKYFKIQAGNFDDVSYFLWLLSVKIYTITIIVAWYFSCKHWWKSLLLFPLSIEINNLLQYLNIKYLFFTEINFFSSFPIIVILNIGIIYASRKLKYEGSSKGIYTELNMETVRLSTTVSNLKSNNYKAVKKELINLRTDKATISKKEYLKELISLRDKIIIEYF
ncbi:hypothetical protein A9Q87_09325 [Flavobacteriales bacterium 34_180_T64]|nr:hypothetical protein A9Q87_09325 [Flavobacteriales bacterium 34_180_T64]